MKSVVIDGFTETENNDVDKTSEKKSGGFQAFGLSSPVLKGVKLRGYKVPTPIQRKCIPLIISGKDVVAMARTGSGKTACFLLPMFEKLGKASVKAASGPRAVLFSPTRELALQTAKFIRELGKFTNLKTITILGGDSMSHQFGAMHDKPDIIVATPGRFLHICLEMELKLNAVEYVVFDEADRLFELGFGEQLQEILHRLPENRQTLLFSATLPKLLIEFAKVGLSSPVLIRLDVETKLPQTLKLAFLSVRMEEKSAALLCILQSLPKNKLTMVFTATKHHVDYLHALLDKAEIPNTILYSDLAPAARKINVAKFQKGSCPVIIVTDVAARGIDIPQLDYVINYHFPSKPKLFVHRVGRCARAGRSGTAFSLIAKSEIPYFIDLVTFLGKPLNKVFPHGSNCINSDEAFGRIPDNLVEAEYSRILLWHKDDVDLDEMKKTSDNGYKKYMQSNTGASKESLKEVKNINLSDIVIHPFFQSESDPGETAARELLSKMKNYKPQDTVFELKSSMNQKCYEIMKKTKNSHADKIRKFKTSMSNKGWLRKETDKDAGEDDGNEKTKLKTKRKIDPEVIAPKRKKMVDEEYYVPYRAPDHATENGLSVRNFFCEANKASFDITGDCEEEFKIQKRIRKWDKEKKKYVTVGVSKPDEVREPDKQNEMREESEAKPNKFKSESGRWIDSSFKTGKYEKWKERSKVEEQQDSNDSDDDAADDNDDNDNRKIKKKGFPNTRWGRHNQKMAAKLKMKSGLKRPEQILKERKELEKKRQKSIPKSKRKNFSQSNNKRKRK